MNPRLNRIPNPWPGGPNDDLDAEPVVVRCALCDCEIDDGKSDQPPTIMRCPNCGPVCLACCTARPARGVGTQYSAWISCDGCGAEVKVAT